jgi:quinolinate synthase
VTTTDLPLLSLGRDADLRSEPGVDCPGSLPAASDPDLVARARAAKAALGERVFVLGHHYQRDEVIEFADVTGDSFKLARDAAARPEAEYVVFCGVHFMAESADILTSPAQQVILPDLAAGCSMADMAALAQVEDAWDALDDAGVAPSVVPVTYMNSSADIKASVAGTAARSARPPTRRSRSSGPSTSTATRRCCSFRTSTSAATRPSCRWGCRSRTAWSGTRTSPTAV